MTNGAAAGAVAAAAAIANAIKASGVIVKIEAEEFEKILGKVENPLVVCAQGGFLSTKYQYLMPYKGLALYCKSATQLTLPTSVETIIAKKIWIPA